MACCQSFLVLVVLTSLTAGQPVDRHLTKRDSSNHQVVEVPGSSYIAESPDRIAENQPVSSLGNAENHHPQLESHSTPSSVKVPKDNNDISQSTQPKNKELLKSPEQVRRKSTSGRKGPKRGKKSNTELLHHLGMTKLRSPAINHHRKRLASQSRKTHHQKNNGDSKMFVIKLPPNPYYYAHHDMNGLDVVDHQPKSVNNPPVHFKTNGKPSRVYHWNIPVLKKMVARKAGSSGKAAIFTDSDIFNIDKQATWNETDDDKSIYRKATYYGPKRQSKHPFRKYFSGNGKPHSFYVIEKSKKPAAVHRLLP